jgi:uncharacterized protein YndB with AHSA1/START domain
MKRGKENGACGRSLRFEYELDAPPAQVWRAVTIPEYVAQWLTPRPAPPEAPARPVLLDCEPGRSARYAWSEDGDGAESIVTFRLAPNDAGGTIFSIVHELVVRTDAVNVQGAANSNMPTLLLAA